MRSRSRVDPGGPFPLDLTSGRSLRRDEWKAISQSGTAAESPTTTANMSERAARLADCSDCAGTVPSGPGSARVAVAPATTVGAKPRLNALRAVELTHMC